MKRWKRWKMRIIKTCAALAFPNYLAINLPPYLEIQNSKLFKIAEAAWVAAFLKLSGETVANLLQY